MGIAVPATRPTSQSYHLAVARAYGSTGHLGSRHLRPRCCGSTGAVTSSVPPPRTMRCAVVSPERSASWSLRSNRLAPEHPHPAGLDDCAAALNWLAGQPDVDSSRVAIGGASAGGGLAAAFALRTREKVMTRPVLQLLVYPMLDDRPAYKPDPEPQLRRLMDQGMNRSGWESYLSGVDPDQAVPARAA